MINILKNLFQRSVPKPAKKKARILKKKDHQIDNSLIARSAMHVINTLQKNGFSAFIVGGAVRDLILNVTPKDFDVVTNATPEEIKLQFKRAFIIGRRFQIVHVAFAREIIEVATFRGFSDKKQQTDKEGRLLQDNQFGTQDEDANRRDFTINALYYNPTTSELIDYHGGFKDIQQKNLKIIGEPEERYREDPVRMLRLVRFATKLNFKIDNKTANPISKLSSLIKNIPDARLLDEMIKLLTCGQALTCLRQLEKLGLSRSLFPLLDVELKIPHAAHFIETAMIKTDERIKEGKSVSSSFLFATLLWPLVSQYKEELRNEGFSPGTAMQEAIQMVLDDKTQRFNIHKRITNIMREIWFLQHRFEGRINSHALVLLEHQFFKAAYDFLLIRSETNDVPLEVANWWQSFYEAKSQQARISLIQEKSPAKSSHKKPRSLKKFTKKRKTNNES